MPSVKILVPSLGMVVRPHGNVTKNPSKWEGVIVDIVPPRDEDHGYVAVWLKRQLNYGADNCEHYAFYSHEQLATILKQIVADDRRPARRVQE